ncbi:50S ribosomal protein L35 [Schnuerera sp. xch1]|uniref:50S ribosomal protein L35 n=1 Tax=Schnuerera sp. xch1 TaxID=2874283 RepID=UPI001CC0E0F0|nr:50S ribosomal protein L35 [Schnuerera sp. xch1]MBZ2175942.1 50S ribosomal protein L35 [Schnuerera sp. xch1]
MAKKMKTHRGAAKRFKRTGTGKIKRFKAYKSHKTGKKSAKRVRNLRKPAILTRGEHKKVDQLLPR